MINDSSILAISVGNTRTQLGRFDGAELVEVKRTENDSLAELVQTIVEWWRVVNERGEASLLMASVDDDVANRLASAVEDQLGEEVYRVGDDLPVPIGRQLDPETITGVDRLLNAAAAFDVLKQACVVVDAGTAVTVDFIDGDGTFHGGAIAPGAKLQLRSLHDFTSALPELEFQPPDAEPFGRSTSQAMLQGVFHGIRGLVWRLVEQYATAYGAYPTVIATGGDAEAIFADDEIVDRIIPELTLMGIAAAARRALARDDDG